MFLWDFIYVLMLIIYLEIIVFAILLLIKTFKKKSVIKLIIGTFLTSLLITCISTGYNMYKHVGENEIGFYSQNDINQVKEVLDNNNFDYDVIIGKKIKLQNSDDVQNVLDILIDFGIGYRK